MTVGLIEGVAASVAATVARGVVGMTVSEGDGKTVVMTVGTGDNASTVGGGVGSSDCSIAVGCHTGSEEVAAKAVTDTHGASARQTMIRRITNAIDRGTLYILQQLSVPSLFSIQNKRTAQAADMQCRGTTVIVHGWGDCRAADMAGE